MKVLIIEDEKDVAVFISEIFLEARHTVDVAANIKEAQAKLLINSYDLVTLDLMLENGRGESLIRLIKKANQFMPIMVVSSISSVDSTIALIKAGVDDYISKPFSRMELLVRAESLFKRCYQNAGKLCQKLYFYNGLKLDWGQSKICFNRATVQLTNKETSLLKLLFMNKGRTVKRSSIVMSLWGSASETNPNRLDVLIKRLRTKLFSISSKNLIKSKHGIGYMLVN